MIFGTLSNWTYACILNEVPSHVLMYDEDVTTYKHIMIFQLTIVGSVTWSST